jgi:tetratricopeptide (TPR) repeat protein
VKARLLFSLFCLGAIWPATGWAQASDADRATARALAHRGYEAGQRGDYAAAAEDFEKADALVHAPTLLLGLARAEAGLGRLVEAQETYQRILREGADPGAPAPFARALEDAAREVKALAPRLAWVTIDVHGPATPSVKIDREFVPQAALGIPRACNPGEHTVSASAEAFASAQKTFEVGEGGVQSVTLVLDPLPSSDPRPLGGRVGMAALGIGIAGLLVGGVTGAIVLAKHASLAGVCPDGHCSESESDELSTYRTLATVSTASTLGGACAAAAGAALLLATPKAAPVTPYAGLLSAGLAGRF